MVASKKNGRRGLYHRDVPMLLDLSMDIVDIDLALDLAGEIISNYPYIENPAALSKALDHLRAIAKSTIERDGLSDPCSIEVMRRIISIYDMMSASKSEHARHSISVPFELNLLLEACATVDNPDNVMLARIATKCEKRLVELIAETAAPVDVINTFAKWGRSNGASATVLPALRSSLLWGAHVGIQKELSGALMRIQQARRQVRPAPGTQELDWQDHIKSVHKPASIADGRIWQKLTSGDVSIKK
uniref:Uncharacterized protein n=1 Tax=Trieres chinensis TaxID=1514140 RepID=A0A7S1ZE75_TRICV|mmetsp:Transcript_23704/g.48048  ORF Transcript_23704/g.48048 Transcript_23704/m.48048 type:complete len:246 (+) Transcript_23704:3-740(+)